MRDLLLDDPLRPRKCMKASGLSENEVLRRSNTSASQLANPDGSNKTKSLDKMVVLLAALGFEVELKVRPAGCK